MKQTHKEAKAKEAENKVLQDKLEKLKADLAACEAENSELDQQESKL
jgi:prefoldin subunit 5